VPDATGSALALAVALAVGGGGGGGGAGAGGVLSAWMVGGGGGAGGGLSSPPVNTMIAPIPAAKSSAPMMYTPEPDFFSGNSDADKSFLRAGG
jgi:hypothetical protein